MGTEVLLLGVLAGITLLAYMVAINSHGPTRLSISYLLATILLAGTVWAIVQHVNSGLDKEKMAELRRLELEKQAAEERIKNKEEELMENKHRTNFAARLNDIINRGTGLATTMMNVDLRNMSYDLETLLGRAAATKKKSSELKKEFESLEPEDEFFTQSMELIDEALTDLTEAGRFYYLYYRSEDTTQEELRERLLRQKARKAYESFKKAGSLVVSNT
ncbi:MAG: hypothetical protein GF401_13080 [Chitinivibrionales bacterium]|nr:hypothetical protein [Chitinivibrionales bacterium]